jgi:hypothetical protein
MKNSTIDSLSWFFNYLEENNHPIIKTANFEKVVSDLKEIPDFQKYFRDTKEELKELNKRYTNGEIKDDEYNKLKEELLNEDYTILNSHAEFYLYQDPNFNAESTKYIYCECLSVKDENTGQKLLLYAYFDAGTDGVVGNEFQHGTTTQSFINFSNSLVSPGLKQFDGVYYSLSPISSDFITVRNEAENKKKS